VSDINKDNVTPKKNGFMKGLIEQVELVVIVFVIIVLLFSFAARICQVSGDSMRDTLYNGENVVVSDVFYTPQRGDIIVFHQTGESANDYNEPIVKRVIGVAGDTVKVEHLRDGMRVTVTDSDGNSTVLDEDYIRYEYPTYSDSITYVEEGTVFVMGDNRSDSSDSRSMRIGLVDTRRILGKVVVRVTPFSRFGKVN
jgi:signal peptidase I